jgi:hypothetical protein
VGQTVSAHGLLLDLSFCTSVRVLRVRPLKAELRDGAASGRSIAYELAKVRLTGGKGKNRKDLNLR